MGTLNLNQILLIYTWFPLAALLAIILLIARFYQNQAHESTRYPLFALPVVLFGLAAAHYANLNLVTGDAVGDLLMFTGGVVLAVLCVALYRQMTAGR
jgi:hypothetical protein